MHVTINTHSLPLMFENDVRIQLNEKIAKEIIAYAVLLYTYTEKSIETKLV